MGGVACRFVIAEKNHLVLAFGQYIHVHREKPGEERKEG